jgi:hypothetical protein
MEQVTTFNKIYNIYDEHNFSLLNIYDFNNRLLCSFSNQDGLDNLIENIRNSYSIDFQVNFLVDLFKGFQSNRQQWPLHRVTI